MAVAALLGALAVVLLVVQRGNELLFGGGTDDEAAPTATGAAAAAAVQTVKLTVPEGFAVRDIAPRVRQAGISPARYRAVAARARPPQGFLARGEKAPSIEGFLFPATYDIPKPVRADAFVRQQIAAFRENFAQVNMAYARSRNLSRYDVLKIASLIEREAAAPEDRGKISAVIYNRLKAGMPLQIDATTQYAIGAWREPTAPELRQDDPYNTRLRTGLPPTPICNPGLASLRAAARPARGTFLYYVAIPGDAKRRHFFTDSYDEFLRFQRENPAE